MFSTMMDDQLSHATLLRYGSTFHSKATVSTWTGTEFRVLTFGEVGEQAAKLANALVGLGVKQGDRVGTFMWNNNEHFVVYSAVPAMGAVLHALNIRLFPEQLIYVATHADDQVILVDASLAPLFNQYLPQLTCVRHIIVTNGPSDSITPVNGVTIHAYDELLADQPSTYDFPVIDERSPAAMCYTSGTTGDPKGVVYSHRSNVLHSMQATSAACFNTTPRDNVLMIVPMFHANAWGLPYAALLAGSSLVMPDRFLQPEPLLQIMAASRPTRAGAVPTIWTGVLAALDAAPQDISHLEEVLVGGATVPPTMMHRFYEEHGVRILQAWGMTETSPLGSVARPPARVTDEDAWPYRYTQGRFAPLVQARLVADDGSIVPNDGSSLGEVQVRGPWITGAYYSPDGPVVTDDKFDDGWLRTGDVGSISPEGYLVLSDRSKDVIKSGGEWISSVDLEIAVMAHADVLEAAAIGIPDQKWDERPLVCVVLKPGVTADAAALRDFISPKFAKWQLPENWAFIDEVPKTSVGKFDKKVLRARQQAGEIEFERID